jgi:hypothetical protein
MARKAKQSRGLVPRPRGDLRVALKGRQRLHLDRGRDADVVTLFAPDGRISFSVRVTPGGPVLCFDESLTIETNDALELKARRVAIQGREGVSIQSGADAAIDVAGDLTSTASVQNLRARLGNVNLKANDDVRLRGERIRLNC